MNAFTIGFTKKPARKFFSLLEGAGAKRIVDVRLKPNTQLSGFAKSPDLDFLLDRVAGIGYVHVPELAPDKQMLDDYRKSKAEDAWSIYEKRFLDLMAQRQVEETVSRDLIDEGCLLCSEAEPDQCHRRLVVEYLAACWGEINVTHLV